jgi:hypothetical protein
VNRSQMNRKPMETLESFRPRYEILYGRLKPPNLACDPPPLPLVRAPLHPEAHRRQTAAFLP